MTNQNGNKPPTNKKRKNEDMSSNHDNNDKHKDKAAIQIPNTFAAPNPKMLDLCLGFPNNYSTPTPSPSPPQSHPPGCQYSTTTPTPSPSDHRQLGLSVPELPNPNPNPFSSPAAPQPPPGEGNNKGKSETIEPPYEWATDRRATVHTFEHLLSKKIEKIKGDVKCKRCECEYEMEFDLREKFLGLKEFLWRNKGGMHERAPEIWKNPTLPTCRYCHQENSAKPVIGSSKKRINWLFLLLGQLLGCCTLEQLKYFCKHTKNHRTGAKDRLLYLAYLTLCKQLHPAAALYDR